MPVVGLEYNSDTSYLFYINLVLTIIYLIASPIAMLFAFDTFQQYKFATVSQFILQYLLAIYSVFINSASESI